MQRSALIGFAAIHADAFMHFGIALALWGTGVAEEAHDAVLDRLRAAGQTRAWLRDFTDNGRGRRFYERLGWGPKGERTQSTFAPFPELLHYERGLSDRPIRHAVGNSQSAQPRADV